MHVFRACAQFNSSALKFSFSSQQLSADGGSCVRVFSHVTLRPTSPGLRPLSHNLLSHFSPTQILNQVRIFQDHVTSPSKVHEVPE